jgi:hypothetical protein
MERDEPPERVAIQSKRSKRKESGKEGERREPAQDMHFNISFMFLPVT